LPPLSSDPGVWDVTLATVDEGWGTWQVKAACRGPESALFFPPSWTERRDERKEREERAKAICEPCGVRRACLEFAVATHEQHGIWGGLNESERRHLAAGCAESPKRGHVVRKQPAGATATRQTVVTRKTAARQTVVTRKTAARQAVTGEARARVS